MKRSVGRRLEEWRQWLPRGYTHGTMAAGDSPFIGQYRLVEGDGALYPLPNTGGSTGEVVPFPVGNEQLAGTATIIITPIPIQ